jgi:CxxC motif-containing protein (DUF1111 family)
MRALFRARFLFLATGLVVLASCAILLTDLPEENQVLDAPIEGLTPTQLGIHLAGDEQFGRSLSPEEGVGPIFSAVSCSQCHVGEGKGHPIFNLTRFGRMNGDVFDPMRSLGGPQLQDRALPGFVPEQIPEGATGVSQFMPPAVAGLGYLEAIDDATLLALADPEDLNGDGISGRVQLVGPTSVITELAQLERLTLGDPSTRGTLIEGKFIGRFGRKASSINLLHQTMNAYLQDMGLTTPLFPKDLLEVATGNFAEDGASDPEISSSELNAVVFYLKTLRVPLRRDADAPDVMAGEGLFADIGCASCHLPSIRTGFSEIRELSGVLVHPFTDLLLHDMGPDLDDGYTEGRATTSEWRTTPLWGLGLSASLQGGQAFFMHDGRARTLVEAIALHGGEGAASRDGFAALSQEDQARVTAFLRSL